MTAGKPTIYAWMLTLAFVAATPTRAQEGEELDRKIESSCPGYLAWLAQHQAHRKPASATPVTRPALRRELLQMQDADQATRSGHLDPAEFDAINAVLLRRFQHIVVQEGFPTQAMVGQDGVDAAWLLTQHADDDPAFQARMLQIISAPVRRDEFQPSDIAMLTDRVRLKQGKLQIYGSQFGEDGGELRAKRLMDPGHVDQRRAAVGMQPLTDYACAIRVIYAASVSSP